MQSGYTPSGIQIRVISHFNQLVPEILHITRDIHFINRFDQGAVLDKMASMQMIDVKVPTADARMLTMTRYTQPSKDVQVLLSLLNLQLPEQPPPRLSADGTALLH